VRRKQAILRFPVSFTTAVIRAITNARGRSLPEHQLRAHP
jgi:hypothetical protein